METIVVSKPPGITAIYQPHFNYGNYTLSTESFQTLQHFLIKGGNVNYEEKYYKLSDIHGKYYEWAKNWESLGYEHIITKVCAPYIPFFPKDFCHSCIWCLDGPTCLESNIYTEIWFWKPILLTDCWEEQQKLISKEWEIEIRTANQQGIYNRIYTLYQNKLEFLHETSTVRFRLKTNNINIYLVFSFINATKDNLRIKIYHSKNNKEWELIVPRNNTKVHLFANFYLFGMDL